MLTRIRRLPSPALVISSIALIAAIGGGSFAFANSDKNQNKVTKSTVKKISKQQIKKAAPGLSVDHANSAGSADTATSATNADNAAHAAAADTATSADTATTADSAQPVAFAHINADGTLDTANSKGVGAVQSSAGLFCISGVSFTPRGGQATVDTVGSTTQSAQFGAGRGVCPAGTQANVAVVGATAAPVYVVLYG